MITPYTLKYLEGHFQDTIFAPWFYSEKGVYPCPLLSWDNLVSEDVDWSKRKRVKSRRVFIYPFARKENWQNDDYENYNIYADFTMDYTSPLVNDAGVTLQLLSTNMAESAYWYYDMVEAHQKPPLPWTPATPSSEIIPEKYVYTYHVRDFLLGLIRKFKKTKFAYMTNSLENLKKTYPYTPHQKDVPQNLKVYYSITQEPDSEVKVVLAGIHSKHRRYFLDARRNGACMNLRRLFQYTNDHSKVVVVLRDPLPKEVYSSLYHRQLTQYTIS